MTALKLTQIGDSVGIIIPKETLAYLCIGSWNRMRGLAGSRGRCIYCLSRICPIAIQDSDSMNAKNRCVP